MQHLTPRQIVEELDRHIIGQPEAKRAVAVAIRNRWRRQQITGELAASVYPKNIIMIGPTGVGKTEIARRLARLTGAPFVKVEATKFTEVGYVGRDVESMVRDLVEQAIALVKEEHGRVVREKAEAATTDRLLALLLPPGPTTPAGDDADDPGLRARLTDRLREQLLAGKLDDREVELDVHKKPDAGPMLQNMGLGGMEAELANMFERFMPGQHKRLRTTVREARRILLEQETDKLLDPDKVTGEALRRAQEMGIIFLDEIDKLAMPAGKDKQSGGGGPDVSRSGVQRDLLPIVEGSAVNTRYGVVQTDHILFIAAGAFHNAQVGDLMPELQGRFPVRVELSPLDRDDLVRILKEPRDALVKQQQALLAVEGLHVEVTDDAIEAIADLAAEANRDVENIGARRLMTIVEKVFEELNFTANERVAAGDKRVTIDADYVRDAVGGTKKTKRGWSLL